MTIILFIILFVLAYLLGSVNSAILVSKLMKLPDPRAQGSGNPGTTNVLRSGSKTAAGIVLLFDVLKGFIPVLIGCWFSIHGFLLGFIGFAAIAGHIFPLFFRFEGGKGVATTFGVLFALSVSLGFLTLIIFLVILAVWRYVSLASICAIGIAPILSLFIGHTGYFIPLMLVAILVVYRHQENIARLRDQKENKLKF